MNTTALTLFYYVLLTALFLAQAKSAHADKFATAGQVRAQGVKGDILSFWGNATNWMTPVVANLVVAYILAAHATSWPLPIFAAIFTLVAIAQAFGPILVLLKDSLDQPAKDGKSATKGTPSAFYRNGLLALAGTMQYQLFNIQTSVIVAYYLLTPRNETALLEAVVLTVLIIINWVVSVVHPAHHAHPAKDIPKEVWQGGLGGSAGILVLAAIQRLKG